MFFMLELQSFADEQVLNYEHLASQASDMLDAALPVPFREVVVSTFHMTCFAKVVKYAAEQIG